MKNSKINFIIFNEKINEEKIVIDELCKNLIFIDENIIKVKFNYKNKKLLLYLNRKNIIINDIQFCPYHPNAKIRAYRKKTAYRKPGNLMIKKILRNWNIDLKRSFMIGDNVSDKVAAEKISLYFEYLKNNFYHQVRRIEKKLLIIVNNFFFTI